MDIANIFKDIETAEIRGKGNYFKPGLFLLTTKNVFAREGQNDKGKTQSFVLEFTVVESNTDEHAVGSTASYVVNLNSSYAMGDINKVVMALLGYENSPANYKSEAVRKEVGLVTKAVAGDKEAQVKLGDAYSEGMLNGLPVRLETTLRKKKDGGDWTSHSWSPAKQ